MKDAVFNRANAELPSFIFSFLSSNFSFSYSEKKSTNSLEALEEARALDFLGDGRNGTISGSSVATLKPPFTKCSAVINTNVSELQGLWNGLRVHFQPAQQSVAHCSF